jgi:hypothetical protein
MGRAYNSSVVAHAVSVTPRWLDNLLTHNDIDGVTREGHGVARRLPPEIILQVFVAKCLINVLGATASQALDVAGTAGSEGQIEISPGINLVVDRERLGRILRERLLEAVQAAPPKTRGRPPRRRHGGD